MNMYRRLTQRDIIKQGDEYRTNWGIWSLIEPEFIGKRKGAMLGWYVKMRREVKSHTEHAEDAENIKEISQNARIN